MGEMARKLPSKLTRTCLSLRPTAMPSTAEDTTWLELSLLLDLYIQMSEGQKLLPVQCSAVLLKETWNCASYLLDHL